MTFQIFKSVVLDLPYDYAAEVEKFRQAKLAHRFTGDAAPSAPEIIERAIRRVQFPIEDQKPDDFVADYEVIDNLPPAPPPPTAAERRAALIARLRSAEAEAFAAVISPGRERLLMLDVADAAAKPPDDRSVDDKAALAELDRITAARKKIQRYFTALEIELEDLPDTAIDGWSFESFSA